MILVSKRMLLIIKPKVFRDKETVLIKCSSIAFLQSHVSRDPGLT